MYTLVFYINLHLNNALFRLKFFLNQCKIYMVICTLLQMILSLFFVAILKYTKFDQWEENVHQGTELLVRRPNYSFCFFLLFFLFLENFHFKSSWISAKHKIIIKRVFSCHVPGFSFFMQEHKGFKSLGSDRKKEITDTGGRNEFYPQGSW